MVFGWSAHTGKKTWLARVIQALRFAPRPCIHQQGGCFQTSSNSRPTLFFSRGASCTSPAATPVPQAPG